MLSHAFITAYDQLQKQADRIPASTADFRPHQLGGICLSAKMAVNGLIESVYIFPDGSEVSSCIDDKDNIIGGYTDLGRLLVEFDSPVLGEYINRYDIAAGRTSTLQVLTTTLAHVNIDRLSAKDKAMLASLIKREWDAQ